MKNNIQELKQSEISSDVFIISPNQVDFISKQFGNAVAEAINIRPLTQKIQKIAYEILTKTLNDAKTSGE